MLLKFLRDRCGNVLPTFAIVVVPLLVSTGAVVDYTNAFDQRGLVQDAMDAAALAAGKQVGLMSTAEIEAEAESFYLANVGVGKITNIPDLDIVVSGSTVDVTTELHVPTYFLGMIGLDEFVFDLKTQVTVAMSTIEVALALDNSGSMDGTKIDTLKTAAVDLVTTLHNLGATSTKPDPVKIGLAPFAAAVNVGPGYAGAAWMDTAAKGTYHADAQKSYGAASTLNNFTLFSTLKDSSGNAVSWGGCVEERPMPYDVSDDPPSTAANPSTEEKKTLYVPMFSADDPDGWTCSTGTCDYSGTSNSTRRYNGAPGGSQNRNNYLPDVGSGATCGPVVTMTNANPAVFTRSSHGLTASTEISFQTNGSLYTGLSAGPIYNVVSPGLTTNNFYVSATASGSGSTFSVTTGNPANFSDNGHGLTAGTPIVLSTSGSLPSGLNTTTVYYVISSGLTSNAFRVSTTSGGSAVNASGSQSGTHRWVKLVGTSGSQSGTHTYTKIADWTCQSGSSNCGGSGNGKSEQTAFGGLNISSQAQCKYGTVANKAAVSSITVGGIPGGPNFMCTTTAVTPLTTSLSTITGAINGQQAIGATNITAGLIWGWRLLSPGIPFTEGRDYDDAENQKILILMTDGANTYYPNSSLTKSWYGAWGYVTMGHLGSTSTSSSTLVTKMNERTELACANVKTAGIAVYTIAFEVSDQTTIDMLKACATEESMAFESNNESELLAAFAAIGDDISLLRIAQ